MDSIVALVEALLEPSMSMSECLQEVVMVEQSERIVDMNVSQVKILEVERVELPFHFVILFVSVMNRRYVDVL